MNKRDALMKLLSLDASAAKTQKAISAKLRHLRHAIKKSMGEEPTTDPCFRPARVKPYGVE